VLLAAGALAAGLSAAAVQERQRAFRHASHEALSCRECHTAGALHRTASTWTVQQCAACHHDPVRQLACSTCHEPGDYSAPRPVPTRMDLTVWAMPRIRPLSFNHEVHEGMVCQDCHVSGVLLTPPVCVDCHADHHRPEANCTSCHLPMPPEVHDLRAHLTCAGSGCHLSDPERRPTHELSRSLCLLCHVEQVDHEPGRVCYGCHRVLLPDG
jgi:hypothetical protein